MATDRDRLRQLLHRWEGHWRAAGAPIASLLRPGASDDHIDEVTAALGIRLPDQARALFGWHDGLKNKDAAIASTDPSVGARFTLLSIEEAAIITGEMRDFAEEISQMIGGDSDLEAGFPLWKPSYFPVFGGIYFDTVFVDTAAADDGGALVGFINNEGLQPPSSGRSLTDLVAFWVQCVESGIYTWDSSVARWRNVDPAPSFVTPWSSYYN